MREVTLIAEFNAICWRKEIRRYLLSQAQKEMITPLAGMTPWSLVIVHPHVTFLEKRVAIWRCLFLKLTNMHCKCDNASVLFSQFNRVPYIIEVGGCHEVWVVKRDRGIWKYHTFLALSYIMHMTFTIALFLVSTLFFITFTQRGVFHHTSQYTYFVVYMETPFLSLSKII